MPDLEVIPSGENLAAEITDLMPGLQLTDRFRSFGHSFHGVLSGVVDASEVVIKPFIGSAARGAEHETQMLHAIRRAGVPTVTPAALCFASLADYLVTQYEAFEPLERADLRGASTRELGGVAEGLGGLIADLHGNGITHGDIQPKNVFRRQSDGRLGVLDAEGGMRHPDTSSPDFVRRCAKELADTFKMFTRAVGGDRIEDFRERVLASYGERDQPSLAAIFDRLGPTPA